MHTVLLSEHPVLIRSIKSKNLILNHCTADRGRHMSHKTIAVSTVIIVSIVTLAALLAESYAVLQSINPVAVLAAAAVVVIGLVWFRKASK